MSAGDDTDPDGDPHVRTRTDPTAFQRRLAGDGRASVAVLGGGVAGLSAAQELAERDFDVAVYEANPRFGGKARSMPGPDRGAGPPLPAEHGFRFFPGFYRHLTDTMARIPYGDRTVADNLVPATQMLAAVAGDARTLDVDTPESLAEWRDALTEVFGGDAVPTDETAFFVNRLLQLLTSCERRREDELESTTWWEFIEAERMSPEYRKLLGYGLTQSLVAMRPQVSSARTIGRIYLQIFRGLFDPSIDADRVLNGPTSDVWIDPWVRYLDAMDVALYPNSPVERIHADGRRVTGVTVDGHEVDADYYVAAVPVEVMSRLRTPELTRTVPSLSDLDGLRTGWMNGLQFYLREDVPTAHGHGTYYDAPWALTSVSQRQFWSEFDVEACGDGEVSGVLSVNVSEWTEPGAVHGKPARECTREEFVEEVWAQLKAHLNGERTVLEDDNLVDSFVDPAIEFGEDGVENDAPLLVNTVDSLQFRPGATTAAPNLLLASDYVRTHTDLASMEAANEAARRAVNAILDGEGVRSEDCAVWPLDEPTALAPLRRLDRTRYRLGLSHPGEAATTAWDAYRRVQRDGLAGLLTR